MLMIKTVIFSKDRATQLSLLLDSLYKNDQHRIFNDITILYTYSNEQFRLGYGKLIKIYQNIKFVLEQNFKQDLIKIIDRIHSFETPSIYRYICFFTDDDVVYRSINFQKFEISRLFEQYNPSCLSLRLGLNTTIQDYHRKTKAYLPKNPKQYGKFLLWSITQIPPLTNFSYPLSVDGHIFKRETILPLIKDVEYTNPNTMEGNWCHHIKKVSPIMSCMTDSCVVGVPINRVQNTFTNLAGQVYPLSPEYLNNQFLNGYRLVFKSNINPDEICGCHQELELEMVNE
jgi:hypothetical protein